jgi:beta-aspartyl-peptidase (threonine type)
MKSLEYWQDEQGMAWVLTGSSNADVGFEAGTHVLRTGGLAIDAVIATVRVVEANPEDHSVGYSGLPNLLGEVELDASIMDGRGLRAGSVGALTEYQDAIDLARFVMEELPHVLIVDDGADRFAGEQHLPRVDLLTDEARKSGCSGQIQRCSDRNTTSGCRSWSGRLRATRSSRNHRMGPST